MKRVLHSLALPALLLALALACPASVSAKPPSAADNQPSALDEITPQLKILHQAPTLDALIAQTNPTFRLSPRDMAWLTHDKDGKPNFTMNRAYEIAAKTPAGRAFAFLAADPQQYNSSADAAYFQTLDSHPTLLSRDPARGTVYQAVWPSTVVSGTGHYHSDRPLFFLCDAAHTWRFVGEGPASSFLRNGNQNYHVVNIETKKVHWTDDADAPVQITCTQATFDGDFDDLSILENRQDALLSGKLPATLQWIGKPYTLKTKTDPLALVDGCNFPDSPPAQPPAPASSAPAASTPAPPQPAAVPAQPETQMELNMAADQAFKKADAALNIVYKQLLNQLDAEGKTKLQAAQRLWLKYRDAECESESDDYRGGSILPMIYSECAERVTKARTAELKDRLTELTSR